MPLKFKDAKSLQNRQHPAGVFLFLSPAVLQECVTINGIYAVNIHKAHSEIVSLVLMSAGSKI